MVENRLHRSCFGAIVPRKVGKRAFLSACGFGPFVKERAITCVRKPRLPRDAGYTPPARSLVQAPFLTQQTPERAGAVPQEPADVWRDLIVIMLPTCVNFL